MSPEEVHKQVRCTLLFQQHPEKVYSVAEMAAELRCDSHMATAILDNLCKMNVIAKKLDSRGAHFQYISPHIREIIEGESS